MSRVDRIDSISGRLILLDAYETTYGIYNHEDDILNRDHPLALVAMHAKEDASTHSALYNTIRRFKRYRVGAPENFNISLTEFLQLPREICDLMFDIQATEASEEAARLQRKIDEMKNQR